MLSLLLSVSYHVTQLGRIPSSLQTIVSGNSFRASDGVESCVCCDHKSAFDLLLKEAWNPEQAAMGNSTLPTVCDKLNIMSTIHLRKLIATLARENGQRDAIIEKLENRIVSLEDRLNKMKPQASTDVTVRLLDPCHRNSCNHSFNRSCNPRTRERSLMAVFNWPLT
jgi:hypothetical protein